MSQEELKERKREELVRSYLNDTLTRVYSGISELSEEAAEKVLKEACKACATGWLSFFAHNYGYDPEKPDLDAFLVAEEKFLKHLSEGKVSITRQGDTITEVMTPGYCVCPLIKTYGLVKPFPNYCLCARNGYKLLYETALKRPVKVDVVESYNMGGNACTIKIELL